MNSKIQSILSYLSILWFVAYFLGKEQRDSLSVYHLRQGFGLLLTGVALNILTYTFLVILPFLSIVGNILGILFLILIILGVLNALNQVRKPLPIIGHFFEDQFKFIDN